MSYTLHFYAADEQHHIHNVTNTLQGIWTGRIQRIRHLAQQAAGNSVENGKPIIILLVRTANLCHKTFYDNLIDRQTSLRQTGDLVKDYRPAPIITVGTEDIMHLFEPVDGVDMELGGPLTEQVGPLYSHLWDTRFKFLDASIWHRYVPLHGWERTDGQQPFVDVFRAVVAYAPLYRTLAAQATLEFQCRMLRESYIAKIGDRGHHEVVTPFKFHSEGTMKTRVKRIADFLRQTGEISAADASQNTPPKTLADLQWRILIVDDQAMQEISTNIEEAENKEEQIKTSDNQLAITEHPSNLTKENLIKNLLEQTDDGLGQCGRFVIVSTPNKEGVIEEAFQNLSNNMFDVILLDYLLGNKNHHSLEKDYGHNFLIRLEQLAVQPSQHIRRGPLGRYWVFPISSFPFAFYDKLWQLGIHGQGDSLYLSEGGDPITTPEMFRFYFLKLLLAQISRSYLYPQALRRFLKRYDGLDDRVSWATAIRLGMEKLKNDQNGLAKEGLQGSLFAKSMALFINRQSEYSSILFHIRELARLMAGEAINQERANSIEHLLREIKNKDEDVCSILDNKVREFVSNKIKEAEDKTAKCIQLQSHLLDLSRMDLYRLPSNIGQCSHLMTLNLSGNCLSEIDLTGLEHQLSELDISHNELKSLPKNIKNFYNLSRLDLRGNPLEEMEPEDLKLWFRWEDVQGFLEKYDALSKAKPS